MSGGLALAVALDLPATTTQLIAVSCIGLFINSVGISIGAGLTGLQLLAGVARWNMIQGVVGGLTSLVILEHNGSLILATLALNLSFLIPIPANLRKIWPYLKADHRVTYRLCNEIFRGGIPYFILAALLVVYGTIDIPILQALTGSDEVGWYALAYRWVSVPALFAVTVATAFFPALSAEGRRVGTAFTQLANGALRLVVFVATPAAVGIALIAQPFLDVLYHGEFNEAVSLLRILAIHIPIVGLDVILGSTVMAADRQRSWVRVSVVASMFNPLLNLFAIPWSEQLFGNGAIGAAIVTVLTELMLMVGAIALRPAGVLDRATLNALLRMILASLTMVPVVLALGSAPLVVLVVAGAVTYGLASVALRTISFADLRRWSGRSRPSGAHPVPLAESPLEDVPVLATVDARPGDRAPCPGTRRHHPAPLVVTQESGANRMSEKVSVLICTRDRPDTVGQAIESVALCDYPDFDIHIMDQSTTTATRDIVDGLAERLAGTCPIVYHHLDKAGLSRAYNTGIRVSNGPIVACTDDDVIVPTDWITCIAEAFADDPEVGLLYGQVLVPDSLKDEVGLDTIVPALTRENTVRMHERHRNFKVWGMGANMAIRRSMLADVIGFDEALGGGAPLRSSQDFDFSLRVYRAGYAVRLDHRVKVDHYGSRTAEQWPGTLRNYGIGDGAFYSKHIRCGDRLAMRLLLRQFASVSRSWAGRCVRQRRPMPVGDYGRYLLTGIRMGARFDVDKEHRLYLETDRARIDVTEANVVTGVVRTAS